MIPDYKTLCAAVMICATLVNTQTHTDSFLPVILLARPAKNWLRCRVTVEYCKVQKDFENYDGTYECTSEVITTSETETRLVYRILGRSLVELRRDRTRACCRGPLHTVGCHP